MSLFRLLPLAACVVLAAVSPLSAAEKPWNVVYLLVDDMGWTDLACYGSDLHETPHIDRLAASGCRFTNAYASASVCTPTRAALLTGEHPARLHMTIWRESARRPPTNRKLIPPQTEENLPREKFTLAERLKQAGYHTAIVGKWHLGDAAHYPETHGFDINIGGTIWGCPATFFFPYRGEFGGEQRYIPGLPHGQEGDYLTEKLTDEAVKIIAKAEDRPFFLLMSYHTVHWPIEAKPKDIEDFAKKIKPDMQHKNATYAAMVRSLDQSVGRILAELKKRNLAERTVIVLTSDNGGFVGRWKQFNPVTDNRPLRSGKGSLYEGGIRVPFIVHWPGVTQAGSVCHEPVVVTDSLPTLVDIAGVKDSPKVPDGVSLVPVLKDPQAQLDRDVLFWHYPHYYSSTTPVTALRAGDWKLLEFHEDMHLELYNLRDDIGEQKNLAAERPQLAADLRTRLHRWRKEVDAQMPEPNPKFKQ